MSLASGPRTARCALVLLSLASTLLASGTAVAQVAAAAVDTPPRPAAPRPLRIEAPREQTLPNGLRVIVAERHDLPLVTADLLILSGEEVDPAGRGGLAAMTAGLLPKGTRHRDAPAIASAAEALGGTLESVAGRDRSTLSMTVTTPKLDAALALMADVATDPVFAQAELDRLRAQSIDDLKVAYARPGTLASLVASRMLFGSGTYGNPPGGTPTSLGRLTRADVAALYRARYRPDNAVLIFAGDIDLPAAVRLATRRLGAWRASPQSAGAAVPLIGSASVGTLTVIDMGKSGQAGVVVALPLDASTSAESTVADVTNSVLGGGYSSRLNQEIRIKRGLSYGAGSRLEQRREGGVIRASVQTKNESASEVVTLVQAEFDRIAASPVPADELGARKATLIGAFSRSVETTAGLATQVANLVAKGWSPADLPDRIDRYAAVGDAQVQQYARDHFAASRRRIAVAGDAAQFEAALKAIAPDLVSVGQQKLDLDR